MKPSVHIVAPRYGFLPESNASVFFKWLGKDLDLEPVDITKGHISVLIDRSEVAPDIGDEVKELSINVYGENFCPLNVVVTKVEKDERNKTKLVFRSNDNEASIVALPTQPVLLGVPSGEHETGEICKDHRTEGIGLAECHCEASTD